jgi:hypothetical protein
MKPSRGPLAIIGLTVFLAGCGGTQQELGNIFARAGDREAQAARTGGLVVPSFYGQRPESEDREDESRQGRTVIQRERPAGEQSAEGAQAEQQTSVETAVVEEATRGEEPDPIVRRTLEIEATRAVSREREFVDKLLRWDPDRESEADTGGAADTRLNPPLIRRYN